MTAKPNSSLEKLPMQGAVPAAAMTGNAAAPLRRAYGGIDSTQRAGERRARLLEAALGLFAAQGYAKTPIEQLCSEAKVTTRHFYEMFDGREALLAALYAAIVDELQQAVAVTLKATSVDSEQQIVRAVDTLIRHYVGDARRARIGVLEVVGVSAAMEQRRRGVIHDIARLIEHYLNDLVKARRIPRRNYHLLSVALVGGINELLAEWLTVARPPSLETLVEEVAVLFRMLLRGAEALSSRP